MADRLSDLPEVLQVRILACLDVKQAIQTSVLSKSWVSLWTQIPVLNFNSGFFDDVMKILRRRDPFAKLDSLKFKPYLEYCSSEILKSVFDYAFSHGVEHLEASIDYLDPGTDAWPVSQCDSLTSLKLRNVNIASPLQWPTSILFKNLIVLHLETARIIDVEPFSGFQMLESLTLFYCDFWTETKKRINLMIHALRLSNLTISKCRGIKCCELRTPRLRFLEHRGFIFPKHDGLPLLETLVIDFQEFYFFYDCIDQQHMKQLNEDLLLLFSTLHILKWLTVSSDILYSFLLAFPDELARRSSPFSKLKGLKVDFIDDSRRRSRDVPSPSWESIKCLKSYLLHNSPDANITITNNPEFENGDDFWSFLSV